MPNDYFNHSANVIAAGVRALAAQVNNIATEIATGLNKLPTEIQLKEGRIRYAVDTGTADAYIIALPYTPTLTDGFNFIWKATNANTGAATLNVNGLGAKSIILASGGALISGDIVANQQLWCSYESVGDNFRLLSQSSSAGGGGGNAATIALLDESADATNFIPFANNAIGNQALFTGTNLTFNAATGELVATLLGGTIQTAAQPNITSLGELVALAIAGDLTIAGTVDGIDIGTDVAANTAKLSGIESGADVTDTANVTSAGALMDSEVDADLKTLSLPASVTISAFIKTLLDDAAASNARATLGVDAAGTVNYTHPNHSGHASSAADGAITLLVAAITGQTALTSGLADADEILVNDGGVIKRMDVSVMNAYFNSALVFKTPVKDHGSKSGNYTVQLDEAELHLVEFSATATLTIASTLSNDKATVIIKSNNNAITLAGINNDSPTLTQAASKQDFVGLIKSFGKISAVATKLNIATV